MTTDVIFEEFINRIHRPARPAAGEHKIVVDRTNNPLLFAELRRVNALSSRVFSPPHIDSTRPIASQ